MQQILTEEEYLTMNGASAIDFCEPGLHKSNSRISQKQWLRKINLFAKKNVILEIKRDKLREEYREKVASGEIRGPSRIERLIKTAKGHSDNESVLAARRILNNLNISY